MEELPFNYLVKIVKGIILSICIFCAVMKVVLFIFDNLLISWMVHTNYSFVSKARYLYASNFYFLIIFLGVCLSANIIHMCRLQRLLSSLVCYYNLLLAIASSFDKQ